MSRYYMIKHRTTHTDQPKNYCYKGVEVLCSKDEFINWYMPQDFSGASVDRISDTGHYELSNMQVISIRQNVIKSLRTVFTDTSGKCCRCKELKSLKDFAKDKRRDNGRSSMCYKCDYTRKLSTGV